MSVRILITIILACTLAALSACDDRGETVTPADISVQTGPDGARLFQPSNGSVAASAYAQWLQLRADLAGIASTGDFLDTQIANLHRQGALLRRGREAHWTWQRLHGNGKVNFDTAIELVDKRIKGLDPSQ